MATNLTIFTVPNLLTCSTVTIEWLYNGTTPPTSNYSLVVTNIGVNQSGLSRREHPLVPRQSTSVVNMTLGAVNVTTGSFDWIKVNIPQGWYLMNIYAPAGPIPSNVFNVTNGLDVSCVVGLSESSTLSSSSLVTSTSPSQSVYPTTNIPFAKTPTTTMQKGAIAGCVVGGGVVLALIAALFLWLSWRRKARARKATPLSAGPRSKGQPSKGNHTPSDSTGAILHYGGNRQNSRQLSTSEEDCGSEKSAVADDTMPKLPSIAATRSHPQPSSPTSDRRPASMVVKPSFESYDSVQSRPSTSPAHSRYPPDRSRRASRKPVPAYNPTEFPRSEPNDIPLSNSPETILGNGTKIYYLIPDAPLEQRR
jgi:hypothetical protein